MQELLQTTPLPSLPGLATNLLFELLQHAVDLAGLVLVCWLFAGQLKHRLQPVRGVRQHARVSGSREQLERDKRGAEGNWARGTHSHVETTMRIAQTQHQHPARPTTAGTCMCVSASRMTRTHMQWAMQHPNPMQLRRDGNPAASRHSLGGAQCQPTQINNHPVYGSHTVWGENMHNTGVPQPRKTWSVRTTRSAAVTVCNAFSLPMSAPSIHSHARPDVVICCCLAAGTPFPSPGRT